MFVKLLPGPFGLCKFSFVKILSVVLAAAMLHLNDTTSTNENTGRTYIETDLEGQNDKHFIEDKVIYFVLACSEILWEQLCYKKM